MSVPPPRFSRPRYIQVATNRSQPETDTKSIGFHLIIVAICAFIRSSVPTHDPPALPPPSQLGSLALHKDSSLDLDVAPNNEIAESASRESLQDN